MLRVGLTGGLGSGKSTVAAILRELGAHVIEADALGRALMEPGQAVYAEIVRVFGPEVVNSDGHLNRARLADLAFRHGRLQELNSIVHPPVIEAQRRWMDEIFARDSSAVAIIESALIFEVVRDACARGDEQGVLANWRRLDRIIVVTAPDDLKISRYVARILPTMISLPLGGEPVARATVEADARNRLAHQVPDAEKMAQADYVLDNSGDITSLRAQVEALWPRLRDESNKIKQNLSLQ
jgi:dephospho-CoA kinase